MALAAAAIAIALTIAVNFLTTDPSPNPAMLLAPERRWHLVAVLVLGMASVGCQWLHSQQTSTASQSQGISDSTLANSTAMQAASGRDTYQVFGTAHFPERPELSREDIQNRKALLGKVKGFWIDKFLKHPNSLYSRARLALEMESQPHRIRPHVEVALPDQEPVPLPPGTRLLDQVDKLPPGGTLLVLGEPGGGKTTLLLELASDLIDRTDPNDPDARIPVVLKLSSWNTFRAKSKSKNDDLFGQWLVKELHRWYQLPRDQWADWLTQQQLVLLLDGLDEVEERHRLGCLEAIQQFYQDHGRTPLVVCCRVNDFEALETTPKFHGTIYLRLLSEAQIEQYLLKAGEPLAGVRAALAANADLQAPDPDSLRQLVKTPLFLEIISMAYRGKTATDIAALGQQGQRMALFDTYTDRMFQQRPETYKFTKKNTIKWLYQLAVKLDSETVFNIDEIQPKIWLSSIQERVFYTLLLSFLFGAVIGAFSGLAYFQAKAFLAGFLAGTVSGILIGLAGLFLEGKEIFLIERLQPISIERIRDAARWSLISFPCMFFILYPGIQFGLSLSEVLISSFLQSTFLILIFSQTSHSSSKIDIFVRKSINSPNYISPSNYRVWKTATLLFGLIVFLLTTCILTVLFAILLSFLDIYFPVNILRIILLSTFMMMLICLFLGGGMALAQHVALRTVLWLNGVAPRNLAAFLDFATERLLVQRVGGSYVFIHRLLQEHIADPDFLVRHGLRLR